MSRNDRAGIRMGRNLTAEHRSILAIATTIAIVGTVAADTASQDRPDFSGRWTFEVSAAPLSTGAPPDRPDQGRLAQGDMGSGWGSPLTITQDAKQVVVEQTLFSRYDGNPQPRFIYALDGSETRNAVMIGHTTQVRVSRATWDGQALRITTWYPGVDPASGKSLTTQVTHRLSLESPTTLIVEVTRAPALDGKETTTRATYQKS